MINVELLHRELRRITQHPEQWEQSLWVKGFDGVAAKDPNNAASSECGTYGCLAGNVILHENVPIKWEFEPHEKVEEFYAGTLSDEELASLKGKWLFNGPADGRDTFEVAMELLGLTYVQAEKFFDGDNDLDKLWDLAEKITLGEISSYEYESAKRDAIQARFEEAQKKVSNFSQDDWKVVNTYTAFVEARKAFWGE